MGLFLPTDKLEQAKPTQYKGLTLSPSSGELPQDDSKAYLQT